MPENLHAVPEDQTSQYHLSAPRFNLGLDEISSMYEQEQRLRKIEPEAEYFTQSVIETSMHSATVESEGNPENNSKHP